MYATEIALCGIYILKERGGVRERPSFMKIGIGVQEILAF
jgi:hypothetical protein